MTESFSDSLHVVSLNLSSRGSDSRQRTPIAMRMSLKEYFKRRKAGRGLGTRPGNEAANWYKYAKYEAEMCSVSQCTRVFFFAGAKKVNNSMHRQTRTNA